MSLTCKIPPGAQDVRGLISTERLTVGETWEPEPLEPEVGDAFKRTVTLRASDVPGMLFPSIPAPEVPGLGVYREEPVIGDRIERGTMTGERTEVITYVCEQPGTIEIPAISFRWWDPTAAKWQANNLPAVALEVRPNPAVATLAVSEEASAGRSFGRIGWSALLGLAALLAAAWVSRPWWQSRLTARHLTRTAQEAALFSKVRQACRSGSAADAYMALTHWLPTWDLQTSSIGAAAAPSSPDLPAELLRLQRALVDANTAWSGRELARLLTLWRRRRLARIRQDARHGLPVLNPGSGLE